MLGHLEYSRGLTGVAWNLHCGKKSTLIHTVLEKFHLCMCMAALFATPMVAIAILSVKFLTNMHPAHRL
jgi:hypothetical protein